MFENFRSAQAGDVFYLRLSGKPASRPVPADSGWVCEDAQQQVTVLWQPEPPASALLWTVEATGPGLGDEIWLDIRDASGRGLVADAHGFVRLETGLCRLWLSRFVGYSDNFVPGYGWEARGFVAALGNDSSSRPTLNLDEATRRLVLTANLSISTNLAAVCSLLYVQNIARDAEQLSQPGQLALNVLVEPGGWLAWSPLKAVGSSRAAVLTSDRSRAALVQLRSLLRTDRGWRFVLGVVASPWQLGVDSSRRLVFGQAGGESADVVTMTIAVDALQFAVDRPQAWAVQVTTFGYVVTSNLTLGPPDAIAPRFRLVVNPWQRLLLGFSDLLQGHINVVFPRMVIARSDVEPTAPEPEAFITARKRDGGCIAFDEYVVNWFPEVVPEDDVPIALGDCALRWISGNAERELGGINVFWLSASGHGPQTVKTILRSYPMADGAQCLVDLTTGTVPDNCGSVRLQLYPSNLGATPTQTTQNLVPTCYTRWAQGPLTDPFDDGYVCIFDSASNGPADPCGTIRGCLSASEFEPFTNLRVSAIVVPENLMVQLHLFDQNQIDEGSSGRRRRAPILNLVLGPGSYAQEQLRIIEPRWPLVSVPLVWAYCSNINPRTIYVAKACSGFPGTASKVWQPPSLSCDAFMEQACSGPLLNAAACGCYLDIARFRAMGLDAATTSLLVRNPPCTGEICARGSAFRASTWNNDCGDICRSLVDVQGDDVTVNGVQQLACKGNVYNFTQPEAAAEVVEEWPWAWVGAFGALAAVAILFMVLFAVFFARSRPASIEANNRPRDEVRTKSSVH